MNLASVKKRLIFFLLGFPFLITLILLGQRGETAVPTVSAGTSEWPMVAANPQRTSWTPEEVSGQLRAQWYKPFEPYIPQHVQIIAANNTLYISTASGLYAIDATTGAEKWVYPTEMPLGHSPTIYNGVAYVGGLDNKIHAINATTGVGLWTFSGGGGFETNPLSWATNSMRAAATASCMPLPFPEPKPANWPGATRQVAPSCFLLRTTTARSTLPPTTATPTRSMPPLGRWCGNRPNCRGRDFSLIGPLCMKTKWSFRAATPTRWPSTGLAAARCLPLS